MKKEILEAYRDNKIAVATIEGIQVMPMEDFINQPVEGMLWDLNRTIPGILADTSDIRWINDYAVAKTIMALKMKIDDLSRTIQTKSN